MNLKKQEEENKKLEAKLAEGIPKHSKIKLFYFVCISMIDGRSRKSFEQRYFVSVEPDGESLRGMKPTEREKVRMACETWNDSQYEKAKEEREGYEAKTLSLNNAYLFKPIGYKFKGAEFFAILKSVPRISPKVSLDEHLSKYEEAWQKTQEAVEPTVAPPVAE